MTFSTSLNPRHVVCVKTGGYVDLEPLKVYRIKKDADARRHGLLRVIDASGDDYLYPVQWFRPIAAPSGLFKMLDE